MGLFFGQFLRDSGILAVTTVVSAGLGAVYVAGLGRALGPDDYGTVVACTTATGLFSLVLAPLDSSLTKAVASYHGAGTGGKTAALLAKSIRAMLLAMSIAVALAVASAVVRRSEGGAWTVATSLWTGLLLGATIAATVTRSFLRGEQRFLAFGVNQVVESGVRLGAGLIAAWAVGGTAAGLSGYAIGTGAAVLIALYQLRDVRARPAEPFDLVDVSGVSAPWFFFSLYTQTVASVDVLVAQSVLQPAEAGVYAAVSTLARTLYLAATPVYLVLFSRLTSLHASGLSVVKLATMYVAPLVVLLVSTTVLPWLWGEELVVLAFGPKFQGGQPVLLRMWITTTFLIAQGLIISALTAMNRLRAVWTLLLPTLTILVLLWLRHDSSTAIATAPLIGSAIGFIPLVLAMLLRRSH